MPLRLTHPNAALLRAPGAAAVALLAVLLAALPAGPAAARLPGPGTAPAVSEAGLSAARGQVRRLDARRAELAAERDALEGRLDALSRDIADLKARREGGLFRDGELDRRLKDSLALSERIDALNRDLEAAVERLEAAARALLARYDRAIQTARADAEGGGAAGPTDPAPARAEALARLARLEAERSQVETGLRRLTPDAPPLMAEAPVPADDPEALRAQADRLRDSADRLQRTVASLQRRAETLRDRRALEEEMRDFLSETRFFDEADRAATRLTPLESGAAGGRDDGPAGPVEGGADGFPTGDQGAGGPVDPNDAPPARSESYFRLDPVPDPSGSEGPALGADPEGNPGLPAVEARIRRLRDLIFRLDRRAAGLEAQAERVE